MPPHALCRHAAPGKPPPGPSRWAVLFSAIPQQILRTLAVQAELDRVGGWLPCSKYAKLSGKVKREKVQTDPLPDSSLSAERFRTWLLGSFALAAIVASARADLQSLLSTDSVKLIDAFVQREKRKMTAAPMSPQP